MATQTRMTIDEFLELPETQPPSELVHGEIRQKIAPAFRQQNVEQNLTLLLFPNARAHAGRGRSELRIRFDDPEDARTLVPDYVYYRDRNDMVVQGAQPIPPGLAIEIVSDGQSLPDLREKCRYYRSHGVDTAWIISPHHETVEVWDAERDGVTYTRHERIRFDDLEVEVVDLLAVKD